MSNKKYEFTGETKEWCGHILHRIRAIVVDGENIKADTWYELCGGKIVEATKEDNQ